MMLLGLPVCQGGEKREKEKQKGTNVLMQFNVVPGLKFVNLVDVSRNN